MKVCDVTQFWSPTSGGVRRYVAEKIRHLRETVPGGRHVLIIPGERDGVSGDDTSRVYTIASPEISRVTGYRVMLRTREIGRILAAERPDVVECADPYQVGWRTAKACERLGIPALAFYHSHFAESEVRPLERVLGWRAGELLVELASRYSRTLYNRFTRTLVPSQELADVLTSWGVSNTSVVDLGVDTRRFRERTASKAELRAQLGIPVDARLMLFVGRLAMEKNIATLCEAVRLLSDRSPKRYWLIVSGEGLQSDAVEELMAETGTVKRFPFLESHEELLRLYHAADLFVHPGVKETFGLVALEAQACGLPVLAFCGTSMERTVGHDQSFWPSDNSAAALARGIDAAFERDLDAFGASARTRIVGRFDWSGVFSHMFDVYRTVVGEFRSR